MLIQKRIPERNMFRFYRVSLQADLLGGWAVVREWGRIGRAGQIKCELHDDLAVAEAKARTLAARKRRRGYL